MLLWENYKKMEKKRLDLLVSQKLQISRSASEKMIKKNLIYINNELRNEKDELFTLDIMITVKEENSVVPKITYLDVHEDYLILSKPPNLSCARNINTPKNEFVLNELVLESYDLCETLRPEEFGLIHRLDKDTEGLMILLRNEWFYKYTLELFEKNKVKKTYLVIVKLEANNIPKENTVVLNLVYGKDKVLVKENEGVKSITKYKILNTYTKEKDNFAIVEIDLITGRRHQIRAVLSYLGMPVVGDKLYDGYNFSRLCLFSSILTIEDDKNIIKKTYSLYKQHMHTINNLLMYILL